MAKGDYWPKPGQWNDAHGILPSFYPQGTVPLDLNRLVREQDEHSWSFPTIKSRPVKQTSTDAASLELHEAMSNELRSWGLAEYVRAEMVNGLNEDGDG